MLKVLHGNSDANKELLFLRVNAKFIGEMQLFWVNTKVWQTNPKYLGELKNIEKSLKVFFFTSLADGNLFSSPK